MIERSRNDWDVTCDECASGYDIFGSENCPTWADLIQAMKDAGWKIFKRDGEWRHHCPNCQEGW